MADENPPETKLDTALDVIRKIKEFDANSLVREADLGRALSFGEAVEPAEKIINLYGQIALDALSDFPERNLVRLTQTAEQHYKLFTDILDFTSTQENAAGTRTALLANLTDHYQTVFDTLQPIIAYSAQRVTDFGRLEKEAKGAIEQIESNTNEIVERITKAESSVNSMLESVRQAAGELGVSQQAVHFDSSVKKHKEDADTWHTRILITGGILGGYAVSSLFFHLIPWLQEADPFHIAISKVLIFVVISTYLFVCIRNYNAHKHNQVVDRHRQNALLTYKALVDAAGDTPNSEVILVHAAACIFGPQGTGYTKDSMIGQNAVQQAVELFTKPVNRG